MIEASIQAPSSHPSEHVRDIAMDPTPRLGDTISALHGLKVHHPTPGLLPYLVYEYGLGMLSPYVPNLYELIDEGVDWMRIRGALEAMDMALGWLGYAAEPESAPTRRRWWNSYHLPLDRVRDDEEVLPRMEGLARLSAPLRSDMWRGYHGYDVRELDYGYSRWGETIWGDQSGVRLPGGTAKWSFGRSVEIRHDMTEAELTALGVWTEPVEGADLTWEDVGDATWEDVGDATWASDAATTRSIVMITGTGPGPAWAVFRDAGGAVIGYRRARARWAVVADTTGPYQAGGIRYRPGNGGALYVEALTDFGDGAGRAAASVGFVLTAQPLAPHPPGARWLPAGGLSATGPIVAETPVSISFGRTVRERVSCLLRF